MATSGYFFMATDRLPADGKAYGKPVQSASRTRTVRKRRSHYEKSTTRSALVNVVALLVVLAMVGLTGCRSDPPAPLAPNPSEPHFANWPSNLKDFRFRWTAEPGFDLTTGWAVPLRAYFESIRIIDYTRDSNAGYPGLTRVTPEPVEKFGQEWRALTMPQRDLRGERGRVDLDNQDRRFVGNEELRVLRAEAIPSGFRAFVCDATFDVFKQGAESKLAPLALDSVEAGFDPDFANTRIWRIEFTQNSRVQVSPLPAPLPSQDGPLPAPRGDVFGPWFVTGAADVSAWFDSDSSRLEPGTPEYNARSREAQNAEAAWRRQCLDRHSLNAAQRLTLATTVLASPPALEPAVPGWPVSGG
ncbi:hypothetical protein [Mycolicibacterium sediminis]|uniref:Uncharacterized protein n=1 Tax=Mycolicibacterium sediminis TaxID=1286180 RepID=A0A7I7QY96_9MYCO|nr:hypothetical protein [Mycolicibacterium sediminis]BBY31282.1 hypothetical protein MSEDJ_53780 [Mycolicibacterium sediminis]